VTPVGSERLLITPTAKSKSIIQKLKSPTQAKSVKKALIPKPPGRPSRDFNIFEKMKHEGEVEISKDTYNNIIVSRPGGFAY
jgi:hypothetical protein